MTVGRGGVRWTLRAGFVSGRLEDFPTRTRRKESKACQTRFLGSEETA